MRASTALVTACLLAAGPGLGSAGPSAGAVAQRPGRPVAHHASPATPDGTSVTIGQVAPNAETAAACGSPLTTAVASGSAIPGQYVTPIAGVVTSYSTATKAGAPGQVRPVMFVDSGGGTWTQVGTSELLNVIPGKVLNIVPTRIPVPAGAVLGMQFSNDAMACGTPEPGSTTTSSSTYTPDAPTGSFAGTSTAIRLNASAVVETDADHDGYGDVTQDPCPQTAGSQAPCPAPDTRITKKPKKRSAHRRVKVAFTSTIPGSTFTCAIDKSSGPQLCTSPFKRKLSYGKHTVVVTALSHGVPDPTPVTVRFRILRPAT